MSRYNPSISAELSPQIFSSDITTSTTNFNNVVNLFDDATITDFKYVDVATGNLLDSAVSYSSDWIPAMPSVSYTINQALNLCVAYYDSSKVFISGNAFGNTGAYTFTSPSNTAYIRISQRHANKEPDELVLFLGIVETYYNIVSHKLKAIQKLDGIGIFNVERFPKQVPEVTDSARIQRACNCAKNATVVIPAGTYEISTTINITNRASVKMDKSTNLVATTAINYVLVYDGGNQYNNLIVFKEGQVFDDLNIFISGGNIDGKGLASCLNIKNYKHFTLKDISFHNGVQYGLRVGGSGTHGYELVATNVYCKCIMNELAGNVGISSVEGDSHYTDCIVVDYTVGFEMLGGGSNRLTRCHAWGGIIPEMLINSINFKISSSDTLLRDCYADTGKIGFEVNADARILGCSYYNNYSKFGLDDVLIIKQTNGTLLVSDCRFTKTSPIATLYESTGGTVTWANNILGSGLTLPS